MASSVSYGLPTTDLGKCVAQVTGFTGTDSVDFIVPGAGGGQYPQLPNVNVPNSIRVIYEVNAVALAAGDASSFPQAWVATVHFGWVRSSSTGFVLSYTVDVLDGSEIHWAAGVASGGLLKINAAAGESTPRTYAITVTAIPRCWVVT